MTAFQIAGPRDEKLATTSGASSTACTDGSSVIFWPAFVRAKFCNSAPSELPTRAAGMALAPRPVDENGNSLPALCTITAASAPALAAFATLIENEQSPRCTNAIDPASALGASAVQARPSFGNCDTSRSGAFNAPMSLGPSPNSVLIGAALPGR